MQEDTRGKFRVIAFASRKLIDAETRYSVTHLETLAVVWALKKFKDIIFGYKITVFTDHAAVTELFHGRNLSGRLARWYLTIQEFDPEFRYLPGRANVVADALSRNIAPVMPVSAFTLSQLEDEQRRDPYWSAVIFALESGEDVKLPKLFLPLSQFELRHNILNRTRKSPEGNVSQIVVPDTLRKAVMTLFHDVPQAGHQGRDKCLADLRKKYFWNTMKKDIELHIANCLACAQHKGSTGSPAPILQYPTPDRPFDTVAVDVLQLPMSHQGSGYVLVCVDHFSRFVVLVPLKSKTAEAVAYALVMNLICPYTTPKVLLSDNGTEFKNELIEHICLQYGIKQTFVTAYHPQANGLVERTNRKILETLRPFVNGFQYAWEDWLPQVAASINGSVNSSTGKTPYYIVYGTDKRLPYDILTEAPYPVYNTDDFAAKQIHVFTEIYNQVRSQLAASRAEMIIKQHKHAKPIALNVGDAVMLQEPERNSKLSAKFSGPFRIISKEAGNKFKIWKPNAQIADVVHADRLKKTQINVLPPVDDNVIDTSLQTVQKQNVPNDYCMKLRSASRS